MKILVVIGEGIGNQVQQLPAIKLLFHKYPNATFDLVNTIPHCFWFSEYLYNDHDRIENLYTHKTIPKKYKADIVMKLPYLNDIKVSAKNITQKTWNHTERIYNSEISAYLKSVGGDFGPEIYDVKEFFPVREDMPVPKYDVIVHNGCNRNVSIPNLWKIKLYPEFENLVLDLNKEYGVASIGTPDEFIPGTVNETGKCIEKSIELIRKCKVFISSDTGTYHIAGALGKPGIVIFTATSPWKNRDKIFHKTIECVRRTDLDCSPCQKHCNGYWLKHCKKKQECQNISFNNIAPIVRRLANPSKKPPELNPGVSIITRTFNRLEYTVKNVQGIYELAGTNDYEHIIIDQGSTDGTREWLSSLDTEKYYNIKIQLNKKNSGDAGGMSDGFKISNENSEYVMQFDGDCEPLSNNFLRKIVRIMDNNDDIGILMMFREGVCNNMIPSVFHIIDKNLLGDIRKATCCFIIRRELLEKYDIWKTEENIGWGFAVSDAVNKDGLRILKTMDIKVNHIDGTVLQSIKYPSYHTSRVNNKTNYRNITYK